MDPHRCERANTQNVKKVAQSGHTDTRHQSKLTHIELLGARSARRSNSRCSEGQRPQVFHRNDVACSQRLRQLKIGNATCTFSRLMCGWACLRRAPHARQRIVTLRDSQRSNDKTKCKTLRKKRKLIRRRRSSSRTSSAAAVRKRPKKIAPFWAWMCQDVFMPRAIIVFF